MISCQQHISFQSAVLSTSPIDFQLIDVEPKSGEETREDEELAVATAAVSLDGDGDEDDDVEAGEEEIARSHCVACAHRQETALHDSPLPQVTTGKHLISIRVNILMRGQINIRISVQIRATRRRVPCKWRQICRNSLVIMPFRFFK